MRRWWWAVVAVALGAAVLIATGPHPAAITKPVPPVLAHLPVNAATVSTAPQDEPLAAGARRVAGRVTFAGQPVADARVTLFARADLHGPVTTTEADGRFDFGPLPALSYNAIAEAAGHGVGFSTVDTRDPRVDATAVEIALGACDARVTIHVEDAAAHGPVAGAVVRPGGVTDSAGELTLCATRGNALGFMVTADGYATRFAQAAPVAHVEHVALVPEATLGGQVVRADDGRAVAGATVTTRGQSAVSDESGHFALTGLAPGEVELAATAPGLATRRGVMARAAVGRDTQLIVAVEPTVEIAGAVHDERGQPVGGVSVSLDGVEGGRAAFTEPDGSFVVTGLFPGIASVGVQDCELVGARTLKIAAAGNPPLRLVVAPMARVRGRVLRHGAPAAGVQVVASGARGAISAQATSGADGSFEVRGLAAGIFNLSANTPERDACSALSPVTLTKGEVRDGVVLVIDQEATIAGVVVDSDGAPVANAAVSFILDGGDDGGIGFSAADGSFTAKGMTGGGDYLATVFLDGRTLSAAPDHPFPKVPLRDGQASAKDVRLVVVPSHARIAGQVVRESGAPVPDVALSALPIRPGKSQPDFSSRPINATTDGDGHFALEGLEDGHYALLVDYRPALDDVATGTADAVVTLPDLGAIDGELRGFTGAVEVDTLSREGGQARVSTSDGHFTFADLPAGDYRVHATGAVQSAESDLVTVRGGETAHVALSATSMAHVTGSLRDARSGAPVPDVMCSGGRGEPGVADADGRFEVDLAAGNAYLACHALGGREIAYVIMQLALEPGETRVVELRTVTRPAGESLGEIDATFGWDGELLQIPLTPLLVFGDRLLAVDGIDVDGLGSEGIAFLIGDHAVGATVSLTLQRHGEVLTVEVPITHESDRY